MPATVPTAMVVTTVETMERIARVPSSGVSATLTMAGQSTMAQHGLVGAVRASNIVTLGFAAAYVVAHMRGHPEVACQPQL